MLTERFSEALVLADNLHRRQARKGNDIPYIAHLLAVTATVLEWGGDEDTAIAALLHDAVEDQGGMPTADDIRARFGDRVADLVLACTDSTSADPANKPSWEARKEHHIELLRTAGPDVALITAADKLHNLNTMLHDIEREGPQTLTRFKRPDRLVWYYRSVAEALDSHRDTAPIAELMARTRVLEDRIAGQTFARA